MEDNKRTQTFSGSGDFRSGKNLLNLRGEAQADTPSSAPDLKLPPVADEQSEVGLSGNSSSLKTLNFFDHILEYGIYFTVFLMPVFILPFTFEAQEFNKYFLLIAMSSFLLFVWILNSVFIKRQISFFKSSLTLPFGIFLSVVLLSAIFSVDRLSSLLGYYGTFSDSFVFYAGLFVFYLLSLSLIAQKGASHVVGRIIDASVYSSVLVSIVSLLYFFGIKFLPGFSDMGAGFNPASGYLQSFAIYLLVVFFVALYDFFSLSKTSPVSKAVDLLAVALILLNMILIDWGVIILVLFILLTAAIVFGRFFSKRKDGFQGGAVVAVLFIFCLILAGSSIDFSRVASGQLAIKGSVVSSSLRGAISLSSVDNPLLTQKGLNGKEAMTIAAGSSKASPILGSGVGTYYYDFSKYRSADFNYDENWSVRFGKAYNEMLEKVSTIGILGILAYLFLVLSSLYLLFKNARKDKRKIFLLAALLASVVFQFLSLETALLKFVFVLLLIIASGDALANEDRIVAGAIPMKRKKRVFSLGANGKLSGKVSVILAIVVILGCLAAPLLSIQTFRAEAKYKALSANTDANSVDSSKLEEVTKLNPYKGEYSLGLSRIYITRVNSLISSLGTSQEDLDKVKSELDKTTYHARRATELSPDNVAFWENYGYVYRRMSDLGMEGADDLAVKGFETALKQDPNNAVYKTELGKIYLQRYQKTKEDEQKMNLEKAKTSLEEAIALKNDYPDAVTELALVYFYEGDENKSLTTVKQASEMKKISVATAVQIGKIYYNLGKTAEAEEALKAALKVNSKNSDAHYILGILYKDAKRNDEALIEFKAVLELNPGNKDVSDKINELKGGAVNTDKPTELKDGAVNTDKSTELKGEPLNNDNFGELKGADSRKENK